MTWQSRGNFPAALRLRLSLLLSLTLLGACTLPASKPGEAAAKSARQEECIFANVISDWAELDREHLILYGMGSQQPYLVQLSFPSNDLPFNLRLAVLDADHDGRICGYGFDAILIPGGIPDRIQILSIQKLTKEEAKSMLAAAHPKKDASKGKVAPPVPPEKPAG